jgi:leucyl-tRNA synthetase
MIPHLAAEIAAKLEGAETLDLTWPVADPALLSSSTMTIAVQVGGKLRGTVEVATDASEEAVLAAAAGEAKVARLLAGRVVAKRVYVPGRIVNFVLGPAA